MFQHESKVLCAGVVLNRMFPDWLLTLLLALLLVFLTSRVLRHGLRMWRAESAERVRAQGTGAGGHAACNGAAVQCDKARQLAAPAKRAGQQAAKEGGGAGAAAVNAGSVVGLGRTPSALQRAGSAAVLVAFWAAFEGAQAGKALVERCSLEYLGLSAAQARWQCGLLCHVVSCNPVLKEIGLCTVTVMTRQRRQLLAASRDVSARLLCGATTGSMALRVTSRESKPQRSVLALRGVLQHRRVCVSGSGVLGLHGRCHLADACSCSCRRRAR